MSAALLNQQGLARLGTGDASGALALFDRAVDAAPGDADGHHNRGRVLGMMGRLAEAHEAFARALQLAPDRLDSFDGMAQTALHLCDWAAVERIRPELERRIAQGQPLPVMLVLGYSGDAALQLRAAQNNIAARIPPFPPLWQGQHYRHQRVRLAYISPDFRQHVVAAQIAQLIECHDRSRFEVIGLATSPDDGSALRARLARGFERFHDVSGMDWRHLAGAIRGEEVDVLIDLTGHTNGENFAVLAQRPAPLQLTWLGWPATTGATFLDGAVTDAVVAPDQKEFREPLLHLPHSYFVLDTTRTLAPTPSRAQVGLPQTGFVFCSFNNNWKITAPVFALWMRLLGAVEGSVLWLRQSGSGADANLVAAAAAQGIDPARILFAPHVDADLHLARHACADLFLDTLPYNAHATAADALFAGLPVLTQRGTCFAGRVGASLLTAAGLPELITETAADYEALALALARDPARLAALRAKLAAARHTAPLFDTPRFARDLETLITSKL